VRQRISREEKLFQAKFESLELFVRVIAHELNGPLTGMNLTLQAIRKLVKTAEMQKLVAGLEKDLTTATDLLEELKSLNRREIFRTVRLDLAKEFAQFVEQVKANPDLPIIIDVAESDAELAIAGDLSRLRRVWHNIVRNVLDLAEARKSDGKVTLKVSIKRTGRYARMRFLDDGGGIPRAKLARVFEPFYTTKGKSNRGLGLFIARKIITEHNGKIRIISKRPFTRVTIDLPIVT
jgi:two-component system CheB/CheR fusion protein